MTNGAQNAVQKPEKAKKRFWRFVPRLAWIIVGALILVLVATGSYSGVPLLLGALIAILLYKLTKKLVADRRRGVRIAAWILFVIVSLSIYNVIWWQWGVVQVELLRYSLEQPDKAFQKLLAKDTYGSRTSPQETWDMYLDALRKGDIDLAVKYYVPGNDQKNRKEFLEELKTLGSLEQWVEARGGSDTFIEVEPPSWMGGIRKKYEYKVTYAEPINMGTIDGRPLILKPEDSGTSTIGFVFIESSGLWKLYVNY